MAGIGGTVADVLNVMELVDQELETGSGETDETSAIRALVQAQHYFETLCATLPDVLQDTLTITTTASTEVTAWSTSLLRLDAMWLLDANSRPIRKVERIEEVGGHVPSLPWPLDVLYGSSSSGTPYGYYGNMANFYWLPLPDGTHSLRVYGLLEKDRFTARTDDFDYPYRCHLAFAQFAAALLQIGSEDMSTDMNALAGKVFGPLLKQLRKFDRSEPHARHYTQFHTT
jgi:hypothetical protein